MLQLLLLFIGLYAEASALLDFQEVLEKKLNSINPDIQGLSTVASYDRIRKWLPRAPQVSYQSNDTHTWRAWVVSTSVPLPMKSYYRDDVENAQKKYEQANTRLTKQELFKKTLGIFLDCAVPSELEKLLRIALEDQKQVAETLNSYYTFGKTPQSDRVAAQLTARQLEAQANMYDAHARASCEHWENWAGIPIQKEDPDKVPEDIENDFLKKMGLESDRFREVTTWKLVALSLNREKLWAKYVPDIDFSWARNNYFDLIKSGGPPTKYTHSWSVGITMPLTFPFFENADFKREKAELGISKMHAEIEQSEAEKKWMTAKHDWKRISLRLNQMWENDLAVADVMVDSALTSYRAGKSGFA